jgi:hypothetical protein
MWPRLLQIMPALLAGPQSYMPLLQLWSFSDVQRQTLWYRSIMSFCQGVIPPSHSNTNPIQWDATSQLHDLRINILQVRFM